MKQTIGYQIDQQQTGSPIYNLRVEILPANSPTHPLLQGGDVNALAQYFLSWPRFVTERGNIIHGMCDGPTKIGELDLDENLAGLLILGDYIAGKTPDTVSRSQPHLHMDGDVYRIAAEGDHIYFANIRQDHETLQIAQQTLDALETNKPKPKRGLARRLLGP
ncbi:hypothetical protein ACFL0V_04555 [Nanoarchaeota archaeon]